MYIKPTVETTEEIHAEVSCLYGESENYQTTVSLRLRPAYEFQIPKGNSTNSKCWNVCTSDNSHLGILVQFNVGHCFRVHQYVGSNKIEYYRQESDVDTLEKALVQFVVFHNKNYKPTKIVTRVITTTVVTRETPVMSNVSNTDKLLINLALKNNITTLENGTRLSPQNIRTYQDDIGINKSITVEKLKEKLAKVSDNAVFIIEDDTSYYEACISVYLDDVVPGINTLTEQERQYLELKIREQTEQIKKDKAVKEKTLREQKAKEERELYEKLKKKYDKETGRQI